MIISGYETHPAADLFPLLDASDLAGLARNVKANGLLHPVVLFEGRILDGRNRARACELSGVALRTIDFVGGNPWEHVWSQNAERRHLEPFQKATLAIKFNSESEAWRKSQAKRKAEANKARVESRGTGGKVEPKHREASTEARRPDGKIATEIAEQAGVSRATVERALELQRKDPEAFDAVSRGELAGRKALGEVKRQERVERLAEISKGNAPLPDIGEQRFPVLYADPPWRYEHVETESRAIENQYPTMSHEEICALDVAALATPDAVLFMWATSPKLAEAMAVIAAWGFTYRTSMVWVKDKIGMGYYARQRHELLLIATRGAPPTPAAANRPDSVVTAPRGEHSVKPAVFAELIEGMYPELPRLEMFCRAPREGWKAWGNQAAA